MQGHLGIALLVCLLVLAGCQAAEQRSAELWWSGVDAFDTATITNSMSAAVRKPGKAGGVGMPAVFLHPQNDEFSVAQYPPVRIDLPAGQRLFLLGCVGLADGFDWDDERNPPDGAGFSVSLGNQELVEMSLREQAWKAFVAPLDLSKHGPEAAVALKTHPGPKTNSSYDWAMFGDPVLVSVDERPLVQGVTVAGVNGVLVLRAETGGGTVTVEGLNAAGVPVPGSVVTADLAALPAAGGYASAQFDFSDQADCVQWRWEAEGAGNLQAWGGSWQPDLKLTHLGPTRAVTFAGEQVRVRVAVANSGRGAVVPENGATVTCNGVTKPVARIAAGETAEVEFDLTGTGRVEASLKCGEAAESRSIGGIPVWPALPELPAARPEKARVTALAPPYLLVENRSCRFVVNTEADGLGALAYVWADGKWELAGSVAPWVEFVLDRTGWGTPPFQTLKPVTDANGAGFDAQTTLNMGITCKLSARLSDDSPGLRLDAELDALRPATLAAFRGPAVHAGDRATGTDKGIAIFPGLEYLYAEERSSSTRDLAPPLHQRWTPHKFKITVPLMLVETRDGGPVLGLAWDANQNWDGENIAPGAAFASPDFLTHQDSHLMQLFLPSVPDFVPEHERSASEPLALEPGKPWKLSQFILAGVPEPDVTTAYEWFDQIIGYPPAEDWARDFEDEVALCRHGFLESVWDDETNKMSHVVGWSYFNAPGYAALLLMDGLGVAKDAERKRVMDAVDLVGRQTVEQEGEKGLASRAGCHIMAWEFPYHWGHLPGAYAGMRDQAYSALGDQEADGGWGYNPSADQKTLGEAGTQTSGIVGRNIYTLAKYAAISGDPVVIAGMERGFKRLREMNVPRGAQGWECPILQPDVLASAYALRAAVWAYQLTGDAQYLEDARFWARTGLPFQYAWDDGERPGMRYASIPVFGSTYYTHTWIGLPVQWCGLVYAYGLVELMRYDDNPLWRLQVEGMTASATHQQWPWDSGELTGSYPDSYGNWFTRRNPVHINPEDIVLNVFALKGMDPGLRSQPIQTTGGRLQVTAPCDFELATQGDEVSISASYFPSRTVYLSVAPVRPGQAARALADGESLARAESLPAGSVGWHWDAKLGILTLGARTDADGRLNLRLSGFSRQIPAAAQSVGAWDFNEDTQGWADANRCTVFQRDGALRITSAGNDPYALSGPALIPASAHKRIAARVRMTGGNAIGLFWRSSESLAWGPDKQVNLPVLADGQWHEVEWDLSDHALWTGNILQLRFDIEPADVPEGTLLEVDWIRPK